MGEAMLPDPVTIYESYTPDNTHLMREYMLHIILKNVNRMHKTQTITEDVYKRFHLFD